MAIEGTYEIATEPTRSRGEAGLEHLTAPLSGIRFGSTAAVRDFAEWLMTKVPGDVPAPDRIHVNSTFGRRVQGRYTGRTRTLEVASHRRLRTVVHELAHHVVWVQYQARGHSPLFKRVFRALLEQTYVKLELPFPRPERRSVERVALPRVGAEVIVTEPRGGRVWLGTVLKAKVKYCTVRDEEGRLWNVHGSIITS
jgi:hypothetical protein